MTNAERAQRHKERQAEKGLVQFNVWLPAHVAPDFKRAAELAVADPRLSVRMWNTKTGRTVRGIK